MYYQWSPATGLSTTEGPVTVASPLVTTTYTCSGYGPGEEKVVNGNFDQGNYGFTSEYIYSNNLWNEGTYNVDYDASLHHTDFIGHGHNGGNFMIVNGATNPGANVWTEVISVTPNKYYAFSTWVCTLAGQANEVALLQFSINGVQIGDVFSAPPYINTWLQFYELWYSGNSTTATITILNQNTVGSGNDFGLDDISFCELVLLGAPECTVYVNTMTASANADDTDLCEGNSTVLHALPTGGSGNYSYSWIPANTLDDPSVQHPVATPELGITTYTCHINDVSWGAEQDVSVTIEVHPNKEEHIFGNICSYETYDFFGEELNISGEYEHLLHTQYGCDSLIRLNLTVYPANDTTLIDPSICIGDVYDFHGTLYDQDGQVAYFDTIDNNGCLKVEKLVLTVKEYQMPPILNQYECYPQGEVPAWFWDKTGITYHEDTYDEIILDDPNGGCPIKHRLNLRFHENYYHVETKTACESYYWPITGLTYTESQDGITKTFHHTFGDKQCDSIYVLNLTIADFETKEFTVPVDKSCNSYFWDPEGHQYTPGSIHVPGGNTFDPDDHVFTHSSEPDKPYVRTYQNIHGCDSVVSMNVTFEYTPDPNVIFPMNASNTTPHWVISATEFQINTYDFNLWDNNANCYWDSVTWTCEGAPDWLIEPYGDNHKCCKVYVLSHYTDTIWLKARAFNRCSPPEGVEQKYWLVCSFYGVEENENSLASFDVVPNPNNGQMTLNFDHLTGKVGIRVYDMRGALIDSFETYNNIGPNSHSYDMKGKSEGIYLFVATGREGTLAKKVIIGR